jgi:copper homeostasis protein CutC
MSDAHVNMNESERRRQWAQGMIRTLHMALVAAMNAGNRQEALDISIEIEKWERELDHAA